MWQAALIGRRASLACRKGWVVPSAGALYAPSRVSSIKYGLGEHPVTPGAAWRGPLAFERLLESGAGLRRVGDVDDELRSIAPSELLGSSGWQRIGYRLGEGLHRVVVCQGGAARPVRLTARELAATRLSALGWKSRRIGTELGIAAPTARGAVDRAVEKLGLASSIQLPLLWQTLAAPGRRLQAASGAWFLVYERALPVLLSDRLTPAERTVVERLLLGESYRRIAAHRGVSVRTVANQLSYLYVKFGASSRTELVAALLAAPDAGPGGILR
jgi:DNA-binding NarL/FixJ family response regulator